jgi:hypothetical protein
VGQVEIGRVARWEWVAGERGTGAGAWWCGPWSSFAASGQSNTVTDKLPPLSPHTIQIEYRADPTAKLKCVATTSGNKSMLISSISNFFHLVPIISYQMLCAVTGTCIYTSSLIERSHLGLANMIVIIIKYNGKSTSSDTYKK